MLLLLFWICQVIYCGEEYIFRYLDGAKVAKIKYLSGYIDDRGHNRTSSTPGARYYHVGFEGFQSGEIIINGGLGFDSATTRPTAILCDSWLYSLQDREWRFIGGYPESSECPSSPIISSTSYEDETDNFMGVRKNHIGVRVTATEAVIGTGLITAYGYTPSGAVSDFWLYDFLRNQWRVLSGNFTNSTQVCGSKNIYSEKNRMAGRFSAVAFQVSSDEIMVFSGHGPVGKMNDIWKIDITTGMQKWVAGSCDVGDQKSYVHKKGVFNISNVPSGRYETQATIFTEDSIMLFYGGRGTDFHVNSGVLDDLWEFNWETFQFRFISGHEITCYNYAYFANDHEFHPDNFPGGYTIPLRNSPYFESTDQLLILLSRAASMNYECKSGPWYETRIMPFNLTSEEFRLFDRFVDFGLERDRPVGGIFPLTNGTGFYALTGGNLYWSYYSSGQSIYYYPDLGSMYQTLIYYDLAANSKTTVDDRPGSYGSFGVYDPGNYPDSRVGAGVVNMYPLTASDEYLMFFGIVFNGYYDYLYLNTIWQFNPGLSHPKGEWRYILGDKNDHKNQTRKYESFGVFSDDIPIGRMFSLTVKLGDDLVYFFGGATVLDWSASRVVHGSLQDTWLYKITTNQFCWAHGNLSLMGLERIAIRDQYHPQNTPRSIPIIEFTGGDVRGCSWAVNDHEALIFIHGRIWIFSALLLQYKLVYDSSEQTTDEYLPRDPAIVWPRKNRNELFFAYTDYGLNDLWAFSLDSFTFEFVRGSTKSNPVAANLKPGQFSDENTPGPLAGGLMQRVPSTEGRRALILQGMEANFQVTQTIWEFDERSAGFIKRKGEVSMQITGNYSEKGMFDPTCIPGSRRYSVAVSTSDGFITFGGNGFESESGYTLPHNDIFQMLFEVSECHGLYDVPGNLICKGHGKCINDTCVCDEFYFSQTCGEWECYGTQKDEKTVCSKKGVCVEHDTCQCDRNYFGNQCEETSCHGVSTVGENITCNGKGTCEFFDYCICLTGYSGLNCEVENLIELYWYYFIAGIGAVILIFTCILMAILLLLVCICRQRKKLEVFNQIEDIELVLAEQKMDRDSSKAHVKVNKSAFELDANDIDLLRVIGRGATSVVFMGKYKGAQIAFKAFEGITTFNSGYNFEEFEKELAIVLTCRGPGIIEFFGAITVPPRIGLVMEYCEHGSLESFISKNSDLSMGERVRILREIAGGMSYLHSKSIIHRDLKPGNVLISAGFSPKITDFGLAKVMEFGDAAQQTMRIGTSGFMAPEVFLGKSYSFECDVFSFGVILWCVLTGCFLPYENAALSTKMKNIKSVDYNVANSPDFRPPLNEHSVFKKNRWIVGLVKKCLQHDQKDRIKFEEVVRRLEGDIKSSGVETSKTNDLKEKYLSLMNSKLRDMDVDDLKSFISERKKKN